MGDFGPIIAAVITTSGAIFIASFGARRLIRGSHVDGAASTAAELNHNLRELVATERAKSEVWKERFDAEVTAHGVTKMKLVQAQYDADTCQRRLDNAYADMRQETQTARDSKQLRPGETIGAGETGTE